jgi:IclR family transcriptional regulator, KDG regulon repressor
VKRAKANYLIQSVVHSLSLLEEFKGPEDELGVTELSNRLNLHKNNVFRLLATLETKGYIEQNRVTENYRLGIKTLQLGQAYIQQSGLLRQARSVLEETVAASGETVSIGILKGTQAVYLDAVESPQTVRVVSRVGDRAPAHATAIGKVLITALRDDEFEKHLPQELLSYTPATITDRKELRKHCKKIETQGFALDAEEHEKDVRSIAAPVHDYTRKVIGALEISGPAYRFGDERLRKELLPLLQQMAEQLSRQLGYDAVLKIAS